MVAMSALYAARVAHMSRVKSILLATAFSLAALSGCSGGATEAEKEAAKPEGDAVAKSSEIFQRYADDAAISQQQLKDIVAPFFEDTAQSETRAVVILHGGILIAERYAPRYNADSKLISWSMAKTITGTLLGMMIADGRLSLDQPAPIAEWKTPGDPRGKITLRNLIQMSSGLDHTEVPDAEGNPPIYDVDTTKLLFLPDGRDNVSSYAEKRTLEAAPGTKYEYSSATSHILVDVITRTLTDSTDPVARRDAMLQFARGRLFDPLGMTSMTPEFDRTGTMLGGSMIHGTARDWAKLGEFLRNNGSVKGAQLLPTSWTRFMRTSAETDPAYGGHLWLNKKRPEGRDQVLFPGKAPDDVFALLGHLGQFVVVSPQHKLVIVRLGKTSNANMDPVNDQLARVINSFPKSN